jgi:hypothetical protein
MRSGRRINGIKQIGNSGNDNFNDWIESGLLYLK